MCPRHVHSDSKHLKQIVAHKITYNGITSGFEVESWWYITLQMASCDSEHSLPCGCSYLCCVGHIYMWNNNPINIPYTVCQPLAKSSIPPKISTFNSQWYQRLTSPLYCTYVENTLDDNTLLCYRLPVFHDLSLNVVLQKYNLSLSVVKDWVR